MFLLGHSVSRLAISPSPLIVEYQLGIASHRGERGTVLTTTLGRIYGHSSTDNEECSGQWN